jgi:hypothetical protein
MQFYKMDFLTIISLGMATIGVLIAVQLACNTRTLSTRLLALYLFCMAIFLIEPVSLPGVMKHIVSVLLAFVTFAIGPALFLYTKIQLHTGTWKTKYLLHFMPAFLVLILIILSLPSKPAKTEAQTDEIILYLLFIIQLFTYTGAALLQLLGYTTSSSVEPVDRMQTSFVRCIVYASLLLFSFSAMSTFIGWNGSQIFVNVIQLLLSSIIFIVALLNGDVLDRRQHYTS